MFLFKKERKGRQRNLDEERRAILHRSHWHNSFYFFLSPLVSFLSFFSFFLCFCLVRDLDGPGVAICGASLGRRPVDGTSRGPLARRRAVAVVAAVMVAFGNSSELDFFLSFCRLLV